jgi:hypothetical protein
MITIGKIPRKLQRFFKLVKRQVSEHVYSYFWSMVLAICISHGSTIDRLVKALRKSTHRTNYGEFLWRSTWQLAPRSSMPATSENGIISA